MFSHHDWLFIYQSIVFFKPVAKVSLGTNFSVDLIFEASTAYLTSWPGRSCTNEIKLAALLFCAHGECGYLCFNVSSESNCESSNEHNNFTTSRFLISLFPPMLYVSPCFPEDNTKSIAVLWSSTKSQSRIC